MSIFFLLIFYGVYVCSYIIKGILPDGMFFVGYTYAGELPSSAFAFNSNGLVFTLNAVPPAEDEIVAGGIGRNFVSRHILEAQGIDDAINVRFCSPCISINKFIFMYSYEFDVYNVLRSFCFFRGFVRQKFRWDIHIT